MHGAVVDDTADSIAVCLLFVENEVLGASLYTIALDPFNCFAHGNTCEVGIRTKALPVTSTIGDLAKRSGHGSKKDMYANPSGFCTEVDAALSNQFDVPC